MPELIKLTLGPLMTNCYILGKNGKALIIDPGGEPEEVEKAIKEKGWKIDCVINTHGHADHIGGNGYLKEKGAKILINPADSEMLVDPDRNLSSFTGGEKIHGPKEDDHIKEGYWEWEGEQFEIIHTPGHTPGGICLCLGESLFSGDTLFAAGIGRTDLPGGNMDQLIRSIQEKLFSIDKNLQIFPGHGPETTLDYERENNPFI